AGLHASQTAAPRKLLRVAAAQHHSLEVPQPLRREQDVHVDRDAPVAPFVQRHGADDRVTYPLLVEQASQSFQCTLDVGLAHEKSLGVLDTGPERLLAI